MSGLEVVGIVAAVVSAFHGGAELITMYKKRRAKKRDKRLQQEQDDIGADGQDQVLQQMVHTSLWEGETAVSRQFLDEQRALGQYSQLLRCGDDRAKQELLLIAVSLQAEVIQSLGRVQDLQVIIEMAQLKTLHETTIMKRYEAIRSISELRQRIEVRLPIPRLSVDSALGISRRTSNESLAKTFVTAAANLYIPEPMGQRLLAVPPIAARQQGQLRRPGPSIMTLSSYQYLIPEIRAQDIEILTLAGEPIEHENTLNTVVTMSTNTSGGPAFRFSSSSSSSASELLTQPYEASGPFFPSRTHSDDASSPWSAQLPILTQTHTRSTSDQSPWIARAASAPAVPIAPPTRTEPDASLLHPSSQRPYCAGALAAQRDFRAGFTLQHLPMLPGSQKLHPSWKCTACDFNASDGDNQLFSRIEFAHGVRFRFPFRARSHAPYSYPPDALRPRFTYGCIFCTAEGRRSAVHEGSDALMMHINTKHHTNLTPEVRVRTKSVVGRVAGREEGWDVNLPDVSASKGGSGVGRWMLHAVTSLPT